MDATTELLDRQVAFLLKQPDDASFLIQVEPFLRALETDDRLRSYLEDVLDELVRDIQVLEAVDVELVLDPGPSAPKTLAPHQGMSDPLPPIEEQQPRLSRRSGMSHGARATPPSMKESRARGRPFPPGNPPGAGARDQQPQAGGPRLARADGGA